jgi:flavin-dependent dehydrogenase
MPRLEIRSTAESERHCDVFVIGCGPAGSTIGTLLAMQGRDVAVVDRARHPRFHIGESLLPLNMPILQRLGVCDEMERIGIRKYAAEFESLAGARTVSFEFAAAFDKRWPHAYQVRRSEFDLMLLCNCAAKGARVFEGARVTAVALGDPARDIDTIVSLRLEDDTTQTWRTRFLVDASGRDTFLANQLAIKQKNRSHASAALYGHFRNARRNPGNAEGNITIAWFAHGWFWFIPLKDGTTSVGAVCQLAYVKSRSTDPTTFLMQTIALCPEIAARLCHAEMCEPASATGNYSYQASRMAGTGYLMIGDAWGFIDPVFSSGVYLAMNGALLGADVVDAVLRQPARSAQLYRDFDRTTRSGMMAFSWFILRMRSPIIRKLFLAPRNVCEVQTAITSLLAGDVFRRRQVRLRLHLFRAIYYLNVLAALPGTVRAWHRRRSAAKPVVDPT